MKIVFRTNSSFYQTNCWPTNIDVPPRIGDTVLVVEIFVEYFIQNRLPARMEVVDVMWTEKGVICELWYKKSDIKDFELNNIKLA